MSQLINIEKIIKPKFNLFLFQPQYSATIQGKKQYWIPYSTGVLWSYVQQYPEIRNNFHLVDLIFRRESLENIIKRFDKNPPNVCGFSVYVWNEQYCLYISEEIKKRYPNCLIIFGGPQCNEQTLLHPFIDTVVLAEGEESFLKILQTYLSDEKVQPLYKESRLTNLDVPSPYTGKVFEKIIRDNPSIVWSTVLETNRGCPYACTFCDWGSATYSKVRKFNLTKVEEELGWIAKNPIVFITIADANFGMFKERDLEIAKMLNRISKYSTCMLESVGATYAKNSSTAIFEIAKELKALSRGVTVSVQSLTDTTLKAIKRKNMLINDIHTMMELSTSLQVPTYTELILGLPLETKESWRTSITDLLEVGQHNEIDAYLCILLKNSELNSQESLDVYGIEKTVVYDFIAFSENAEDEVVLPEAFEVITATNTMSRDELIECYLYSWVIIHFHTVGYSQLYAKYGRNKLNISYRNFYDRLYELIWQDDVISKFASEVRECLKEFLTDGVISHVPIKGVHLHTFSYPVLHNNKESMFRLASNCLQSFSPTEDITWLSNVQPLMVYDKDLPRDYVFNTPYNLQTWDKVSTTYTILESEARKSKRAMAPPTSTARNSAFFKNRIVVVDDTVVIQSAA